MENDEKKENAPIRPWREPLYQRLRDMGIEVNDVTDEMEGKTTLITLYRPPYKSQPDKEQNLPTDMKNKSK